MEFNFLFLEMLQHISAIWILENQFYATSWKLMTRQGYCNIWNHRDNERIVAKFVFISGRLAWAHLSLVFGCGNDGVSGKYI